VQQEVKKEEKHIKEKEKNIEKLEDIKKII
jgi:hypothetical protein